MEKIQSKSLRRGVYCWISYPKPAVPSSSQAHPLSPQLSTSSSHICLLCVLFDPLQQMVKSLKKAMAPVLSDVTVEWGWPETTEARSSPVSTSSLFPGERLMGYGIVCDASLYISNSRSVSTLGT